jgi:triosephosphate isomerase (TIM)
VKRKSIIAGNWKMQGSRESVSKLVSNLAFESQNLDNVDLVVFPPFVFIERVGGLLSHLEASIAFGAQDVSDRHNGAFTGEVSAAMLSDLGCRYVLVGHSERRQYHLEEDALVAKKYLMARTSGLQAIVCVGETLDNRRANQTQAVIAKQVEAVLAVCETSAHFADLIIAYEPVWAIGTGESATPAQAQEVHAFIRSLIAKRDEQSSQRTRILYGGSMKPENASALLSMDDIDGGLIGGASLEAGSFVDIAKAV